MTRVRLGGVFLIVASLCASSTFVVAQNLRQDASPLARPDSNPSVYSVAGLSLGSRLRFDSAAYRDYQCDPSEQFDGFTWCTKTVTESESRGSFNATYSILHSRDGTAVYVN